jgi:hypothetical protein
MLRKDLLFNILLPSLYTFTVVFLSALGERRFDVYFSMLTLEYSVLYALFRPKRKRREIMLPILLFIFFIFVAMRIAEVLGI